MYENERGIIQQIISNAHTILIIQADNPDADSLGSALAFEGILTDLGKEPILYCGVDVPSYLHYLSGWDRVTKELPNSFDASIVVDASTTTLLERINANGNLGKLSSKPCIVLDHHAEVNHVIDFSSVMINDPSQSSTGELIYHLSKELEWPLSIQTQEDIMTAILGDTQGLTNSLTSANTYKIMATFIENGVNRSELEEKRREYGKMPVKIYKYKAKLIERTQFFNDSKLAIVEVPQEEIIEYSPLYNPAPLIQNDLLQITGVEVTIVLKSYTDGRVTAAIRTNYTSPIANKIAEKFNGGGHQYASGFKINDGRTVGDIKQTCIEYIQELLNE